VGANSVRHVHEALAGVSLDRCRAAADAARQARTAGEVEAIAESLVGTSPASP
jgi:hypothetical protein